MDVEGRDRGEGPVLLLNLCVTLSKSLRSLDLFIFICKMGPWDLIPVISFPTILL